MHMREVTIAYGMTETSPVSFQSATDDPLRDETQQFAQRLRAGGVATELLILDRPTGWPRSYRETGDGWAGALRGPLHRFLHPNSPSTPGGSLA